jgi:hypothetical protein
MKIVTRTRKYSSVMIHGASRSSRISRVLVDREP